MPRPRRVHCALSAVGPAITAFCCCCVIKLPKTLYNSTSFRAAIRVHIIIRDVLTQQIISTTDVNELWTIVNSNRIYDRDANKMSDRALYSVGYNITNVLFNFTTATMARSDTGNWCIVGKCRPLILRRTASAVQQLIRISDSAPLAFEIFHMLLTNNTLTPCARAQAPLPVTVVVRLVRATSDFDRFPTPYYNVRPVAEHTPRDHADGTDFWFVEKVKKGTESSSFFVDPVWPRTS